jgi:hypothetical protein
MSFYVTLPSNVNDDEFKNNRTTNFTTRLKSPKHFNTLYEVALVEIIYNQTWKVDLGQIIIHHRETQKEYNLTAIDGETYPSLIDRINNILRDNYIDEEYSRRRDLYHNISNDKEKLDQLKKLDGMAEFMELDNKIILIPLNNNILKDERIVSDILKKNKMPKIILHDSKIHFLLPKGMKLSFSGRIKNIFNMSDNRYDSNFTSDVIPNNHLESVQSLYIYTDIIDYQLVGDEYAPLLRNVVVSQNYSHPVAINYENPHYLPVNKSIISTINIDIRDDTGKEINFIQGKVEIKLHFRPLKNGF